MRGFFLHIAISLLTVATILAPAPAASAAGNLPVRPRVDARDPARILVSWDLPPFTLEETVCSGRAAVTLHLPGGTLIRAAGWPEVPTVTTTVAVPARGRVRLEVIAVREHTLSVAAVIPSRGHLPRNVDPEQVPRRFGPFYASGGIWPAAVRSSAFFIGPILRFFQITMADRMIAAMA